MKKLKMMDLQIYLSIDMGEFDVTLSLVAGRWELPPEILFATPLSTEIPPRIVKSNAKI